MNDRNPASRLAPLFAAVLGAALPGSALASDFTFSPPGVLVPGSGQGRADELLYSPSMRFPIENGPAYANSQVWGRGGGQGGGGSQCDTENYSYPWYDNYCESRSWTMPLCPSGTGHQGQDIRPTTCSDATHWTVAAETGTITNIGSYSVYLTTDDGTRYDYLHGRNVAVTQGQRVEAGQRIDQVSNAFGGTPTTIHLHLNIRQDVAGFGFIFVPPYASLISSYRRLLGIDGLGARGRVESRDCTSISGWVENLDAPDDPPTMEVYFGGPREDPSAIGALVLADQVRDDMCEAGSCAFGFNLVIPRRLRDGTSRLAHFYVADAAGEWTELQRSPSSFSCLPPTVRGNWLRAIEGPESLAAWELSPFWDAISVDQVTLDNLDPGPTLPSQPEWVRDSSGARWILDEGRRRSVDQPTASAWRLAWDAAAVRNDLDDYPVGPAWPIDPFMLEAPDGALFVVDERDCEGEACDDFDSQTSGLGAPGSSETQGSAETDTAGAQPDDGQGCGCRSTAPAPHAALLVFFILGLSSRGRRHV